MNFLIFLIFGIFSSGDNSFVFLKNLKDAENIALGEASCALTGDVLSFLSNPALLSDIKNYEVSFYSAFLWDNIKEEFFAFGGRTKHFNYGLSLNYLNYGKIQGRDEFGFETQVFTPYDFAFHIGLAKNFSNFLKMGLTFGYATEKIEDEEGDCFLFSFGANYILPNIPSLKMGFSLINLGTPVKFIKESFYPPFMLKVGTLYRNLKNPYFFTLELSFPVDHIPYISIGGAYNIKKVLEIRGGFKSSFDSGFISSFRFGFGLNVSILTLDYAVLPQGVLGFTHSIDLKFKF